MRRVPHRGFTFTEILVVIAIIGILVALLLPAVQAAREAARRGRCLKQLEQLIMAAQNYEMLHGVFPPGTIAAVGPIRSLPQGYHHNWIIQLLPYLEQKNPYAELDRRAGVYDPANQPVRRLELTLLRCPSQFYSGQGYSDYAAVHHDVEAPIDVTNHGTFFLNSRIRYDDILDGSSHTLFFGEKITLPGDLGWMSGTRATLRNTGTPLTGLPARAAGPSGYPPGTLIEGALTEPSDEEQLLELLSQPGSRPRTPGKESAGSAALAVGGFGSRHPGGAQFAFGDGSVRFLPTSISPALYQQLGHRADGSLDTLNW